MAKSAKGKALGAAHRPRRNAINVIAIRDALKRLRQISPEIRYMSCFAADQFTAGLIAFSPQKTSNAKQITHHDKDVVCHVIKGRGRLRLDHRRIDLRPGTVCHISKGTPHDFAAGKTDLVLFYSLIKTG